MNGTAGFPVGSLREQQAEDIKIFFDLDEMAAVHELNGFPVTAIADGGQARQDALKAPGGIYEGDLVVFIPADALAGVQLAPGVHIQWDGVPYTISAITSEGGVIRLTLLLYGGGPYAG